MSNNSFPSNTHALDRQNGTLSVLNGNEQLFATKYKLVLSSEEELRSELQREQRSLSGHQSEPPEKTPDKVTKKRGKKMKTLLPYIALTV